MTRRRKIALLVVVAVVLAGAVALRWLLNPGYLVPAVLDLAGKSLGLEITASGIGEYRLRGTPQLIARNVTVREPGAKATVLTAERVFISVPWSTLRARGRELVANRLELDAPVLDVAALQAWQSRRPPSDTPIPTLANGVGINRGRVTGDGWKIYNLDAELQSLAPGKPLQAHLRGRYAGAGISAPIDVYAALTKPASGAGVGVVGQVALETAKWRLPSQVEFSARLGMENGFSLQRAVLATQSHYVSGDTSLPFAMGIAGPLQFENGRLSLQPAGLALRGQQTMSTLDATGGFSLDRSMHIGLDGSLAGWPSAWPALPPPLGQSTSPLPFALAYEGPSNLSGIAALKLQRDDTVFDARFHLFEVLDWVDASAQGSPLPPIAGTLNTPKLEISGATLEGVELQMEDPSIPATTPPE
ncbi:MAG: hypothetical protein ABI538_08190 [Pseudoxanthomonas sp.]